MLTYQIFRTRKNVLFTLRLRQQVPQPGKYECDVIAQVRDDRLIFEVDPRQGRRVSSGAPGSSTPQKSA